MRISNAHLKDGEGGDSDRHFDIDVLDALIPCRKFAISYKVAELGKLSLTSEFLLRLIYTVDGILETEAAGYFGFSEPEIAFVIDELSMLGYIDRRIGGLSVTLAGRELFRPGSDVPELYELERRNERHGFDLVSMAPAENEGLSPFEAWLPELQVPAETVARASNDVPNAFRKHFDSLVRRVTDTPLRQSLYAVDNVTALDRYAIPLKITVRAQAAVPGLVEPDLTDRWTGFELDDRAEIVEATARFLTTARVTAGAYDDLAFEQLLRIAPEILADFASGGTIRRAALYREALRRAGDLRIDRQTTLIFGSLFTDRNVTRLRRAMTYATNRPEVERPSTWLWQAPFVPFWGASRRLPQIIDLVSDTMANAESARQCSAIGVLHDRPPRYLDRAFDNVITSHSRAMRNAPIEVLLVPRHVVAVLVHVPGPGSTEAYPLPLGVLSFNEDVVRRTTDMLRDFVYPLTPCKSETDAGGLGAAVEAALQT